MRCAAARRRSDAASRCSSRVPTGTLRRLELAVPLLEEAAGGHVEGLIGDTDPLVAVRETLEREPFDEVIVSTLPARVSHWLHRDLPSRLEQLGLPVTVVTAKTSSRRLLTEP